MWPTDEGGSDGDPSDRRNRDTDRLSSSGKNPGETESSGSVSSISEKEAMKMSSDDSLSPEATSHAERCADEDTMQILTEKLSSALLKVREKEDLAKQHAKVAEEAVSGWEKAENEVASLKQQLESTLQNNSALEEKTTHLDSALKECVRELRQLREDQDQKSGHWESEKNELKKRIFDLETQIETEREASASFTNGIQLKLKAMEKENEYLKAELLSQSEELNIRTLERELSTQAAEIASKQHLESIKKVTKLESECLRLRALACKKSSVDHKPITRPLSVDSLTDSQSDEPTCSSDQFKAHGIDLMDDFVQMEKLAALTPTVDLPNISEFEEKIQTLENEKVYMEAFLSETQDHLANASKQLVDLQEDLALTKNSLKVAETKMESAFRERKLLESQLEDSESNLKAMREKIEELEREMEEERALSAELAFNCRNLEDELLRRNQEIEVARTALLNGELKMKQEKELVVAASKLAECQKTIASLGQQLRSLANLDDLEIEIKHIELNGGSSEARVLDEPILVNGREDARSPSSSSSSSSKSGLWRSALEHGEHPHLHLM